MKKIIITENQFKQLVEGKTKNAVVILLRYGDKVLILKRGSSADWMPNKWGLLGGAIEKGESTENAVIRECQEEIGLKPENIEFIETIDETGTNAHFFVGELVSDKVKLNFENQNYHFMDISEIDQFDFVPHTKDFIKQHFTIREFKFC